MHIITQNRPLMILLLTAMLAACTPVMSPTPDNSMRLQEAPRLGFEGFTPPPAF